MSPFFLEQQEKCCTLGIPGQYRRVSGCEPGQRSSHHLFSSFLWKGLLGVKSSCVGNLCPLIPILLVAIMSQIKPILMTLSKISLSSHSSLNSAFSLIFSILFLSHEHCLGAARPKLSSSSSPVPCCQFTVAWFSCSLVSVPVRWGCHALWHRDTPLWLAERSSWGGVLCLWSVSHMGQTEMEELWVGAWNRALHTFWLPALFPCPWFHSQSTTSCSSWTSTATTGASGAPSAPKELNLKCFTKGESAVCCSANSWKECWSWSLRHNLWAKH